MWNVIFIIGAIVVGYVLLRVFILHNRGKEMSDWQVGDVILFTHKLWMQNERVSSAHLTGWNLEYVFVDYNGITHKVDYSDVKMNKSAVWRRHHSDCEKFMGKKPSFTPELLAIHQSHHPKQAKGFYNGKSIELLNETECEIYLAECIEKQDFETATLIRERMKKFR